MSDQLHLPGLGSSICNNNVVASEMSSELFRELGLSARSICRAVCTFN